MHQKLTDKPITFRLESAAVELEGQLNPTERRLLTEAILIAPKKPRVILEVGTWLGGGSTLHILRALEQNRMGHLWGIESDRSIYERMLANIRAAAPEGGHRFTPLFGFSQDIIPKWLGQYHQRLLVDFAFLDGGNNPSEQIGEFHLLDPHIPVGGQIMAHDAKMRKGRWLLPYLSLLDNWNVQLYDVSEVGLLHARKVVLQPSFRSQRAASIRLLKMRCNPVEIAAAVLPSKICALALRLLPGHIASQLSEGRKKT